MDGDGPDVVTECDLESHRVMEMAVEQREAEARSYFSGANQSLVLAESRLLDSFAEAFDGGGGWLSR